jgi:DeoR family transcriptional regulator, fructose operon transcriptional repressor
LVETEQAMMRAADEVVIVADSAKFGHRSLTHVCELGGVDYLVVDGGITAEWKVRMAAAGVKVMVAERNDE